MQPTLHSSDYAFATAAGRVILHPYPQHSHYRVRRIPAASLRHFASKLHQVQRLPERLWAPSALDC